MLSVSLYCSVASAMPQSASTESIAGTIEKGDFAAAVSACEAALQAKPNDVELTRLHAQALRGMNRVAAIPAALSPAIEAHPRASSLILQRAIAYKQLDKLREMTADCLRLNQLGEGLGFVLLAQAYESKGETLEAVRCYTRLMETYPEADDLADWQFSRSQLLTELNLLDWAMVDVQASIKASPGPLKTLLLGELLARRKQWEQAEAALKQFNTMTDQHYVGEVRRLNVLVSMDELDKVAFLLQQYEQKYQGTDKLKHVADIRTALSRRLASECLKTVLIRCMVCES